MSWDPSRKMLQQAVVLRTSEEVNIISVSDLTSRKGIYKISCALILEPDDVV